MGAALFIFSPLVLGLFQFAANKIGHFFGMVGRFYRGVNLANDALLVNHIGVAAGVSLAFAYGAKGASQFFIGVGNE